jgi:Tol biopolymer transport system component
VFDLLEKGGYDAGAGSGPLLYSWTPTHIYLSFFAEGSRDVWRIPFDAQRGIPLGEAIRITATMNAWNGVAQHGKLVFDATTMQSNLFALPLAPDGRSLAAEPRQLTFDSAPNFLPSLSRDGRRASYISTRAGNTQIFVVDVASGRSSVLTKLPRIAKPPLLGAPISPDGEQVAWSENDKRDVYRSGTDKSTPVRVCSDCGFPRAWLPDGSGLILQHPAHRDTFFLFEFSSGRRRAIIKAVDHVVGSPNISPDGGWVVFSAAQGPSREYFVARLGPAVKEDMSEWISLGARGRLLVGFDWSARGDLIYALDVGRIIAVPLNSKTKYPSGPPVVLYEPKDPHQRLGWTTFANGLIVACITTGGPRNIWIQDLP